MNVNNVTDATYIPSRGRHGVWLTIIGHDLRVFISEERIWPELQERINQLVFARPFSTGDCYLWFLFHCYRYDIMDEPFVDDREFDYLCTSILNLYDDKWSPYKKLVSKETLAASSAAGLEYPDEVVRLAKQFTVEDWHDM